MEEIDLKEFIMLFWNRKVSIIIITIIFMVIGIIYTIGFVTPEYTSSTTLLLATSESSKSAANTITTSDITLNSKLVSTYSELVKSKNVTRQVITNLGINETEEELKKNITVSSVKDTELIKISVTNKDATNAYKIANEIARVFTQKVSEIYNINNVQILDQAEVNTTPSNINHTKDVTMFTLVGIFVSIVYVIIANMLDTTIKTAEEVEKICNVPVIASIPLYSFELTKNKGGKRKK